MNGDYTKVALRPGERWTAARMQQGRVLLEHEWNLNIDAAARRAQTLAFDAIGRRGVLRGSNAFKVTFAGTTAAPELEIAAGYMWVGGLLAVASRTFKYADQDGVSSLPATGSNRKVLVVLDAFHEHLQPAEAIAEIVEPALAPIESAARTRVGYRIRAVVPASGTTTGRAAWEQFLTSTASGSDATVSMERIAQAGPTDPCAPHRNGSGLLPDGLLRLEVLDKGNETAARFAWSFENGAATAPVVAPISGNDVTVAATPGVTFKQQDLVELSWLSRRADRGDHGPLYRVTNVNPAANGGVRLTLSRTGGIHTPPANAPGLAVRRWDGEIKGGGQVHELTYRGQKYVKLTLGAGKYEVGDWWGARVREGIDGVEKRQNAVPDGTMHAFAPLAFVDLAVGTVEDMRPKFRPLVELDTGTCTIGVHPEDNVQAAVDALPATGGKVCFEAGTFALPAPLKLTGKKRVVLHGAGPATVVRTASSEAAIVFDECIEVEVRDMRIEGGPAAQATPGDVNGALTFLACANVRVADCVIGCRDGTTARQLSCVTVRSKTGQTLQPGGVPDRVRIERNRFEVGDQQTAVLLVDVEEIYVGENKVSLATPVSGSNPPPRFGRQGIVVGGVHGRARAVQIVDNVVSDVAQGIHVGLTTPSGSTQRAKAGNVHVRGNVVHVLLPAGYNQDRHAVFVGSAESINVVGNSATLRGANGAPPATEGVRIFSTEGPFLLVRENSFDRFNVGVAVVSPGQLPKTRMWLVAETMASNGVLGADIPNEPGATGDKPVADDQRNYPVPAAAEIANVDVTPASIAAATTATGTVTLTNPARRGGLTVAITSSNKKAADDPAPLFIPAGATSGTFTVTAKAVADNEDTTIKATLTKQDGSPSTKEQKVSVLARPAVKSLSLSPSSEVCLPNKTVTGTVVLTNPQQGATVTLTSDKESVATVPASVAVAGTQATFTVQIKANSVTTPQTVKISASFGGVTRTAELAVLPVSLLKVRRIRVLRVPYASPTAAGNELFDSGAAGGTFFPNREVELSDYDGANAIEVEFENAPLDAATVTTSTFAVAHSLQGIAQPADPIIRHISATTVRWIARSLPRKHATVSNRLVVTPYTVTLKDAIKSTHGQALDGELTAFPSGDGKAGGSCEFYINVASEFTLADDDLPTNSHIERGERLEP